MEKERRVSHLGALHDQFQIESGLRNAGRKVFASSVVRQDMKVGIVPMQLGKAKVKTRRR